LKMLEEKKNGRENPGTERDKEKVYCTPEKEGNIWMEGKPILLQYMNGNPVAKDCISKHQVESRRRVLIDLPKRALGKESASVYRPRRKDGNIHATGQGGEKLLHWCY